MGYGAGYYSSAWCCMFVDWCMAQANASIGKQMNCLTIQTGLTNAGATQVSPKQAQAGDILIFEFDRAKDSYDHVGFCEINKGTYLQTIEGNVSNTVGRRTRPIEDVRQCWRPKWSTEGYTGWYWKDGKCYHLTNGNLDRNGWFKGTGAWADKWFYCGADGAFVTNEWHDANGKWYYFGENGWAVTNQWVETHGQWYYCGDDGQPVKGWQRIDGAYYHFDDDCVCEYDTFAEYQGEWGWLGHDGKLVTNATVIFTAKADNKGVLSKIGVEIK